MKKVLLFLVIFCNMCIAKDCEIIYNDSLIVTAVETRYDCEHIYTTFKDGKYYEHRMECKDGSRSVSSIGLNRYNQYEEVFKRWDKFDVLVASYKMNVRYLPGSYWEEDTKKCKFK